MRMTLRIILGMMTALESALAEVANTLRGTEYHTDLLAVGRAQRDTRSRLCKVLDSMIDSGKGGTNWP